MQELEAAELAGDAINTGNIDVSQALGWGSWQGLSSAHTGSKETHCEGSRVQSGP